MIFLQLFNILLLCLLLSVHRSQALPAMDIQNTTTTTISTTNSTTSNISSSVDDPLLLGSEVITSTRITGTMIYYGFLGIAVTWSEAYAVSKGKQYSGWSFATGEKVPIGTQISFFAYSGKDPFTDLDAYVKITVRVMQPVDGDFGPTWMHFMKISMQGIIELNCSYNVELVEACSYALFFFSGPGLRVYAGDRTLLSTNMGELDYCAGNRPPKQ
eukprot:Nk52_evm2s317 gene=Nk52_evmTU2s317